MGRERQRNTLHHRTRTIQKPARAVKARSEDWTRKIRGKDVLRLLR